MIRFQKEVGAWCAATFPGASPDSIVAHLKREVAELAINHDPQEAADCFILLCHHAELAGYDLLKEARNKLEVNKKRRWGDPQSDGIVEHVR